MTTGPDSFPTQLLDFTILVVDDGEITRRMMVGLLRAIGFQDVIAAEDGAVALDLLADEQIRPDIILCDWLMPNVDGLEVLTRIRKTAGHPKFIMVTAVDNIEAAMLARAHGADGYLIKPVTKASLQKVIDDTLGRL
ncbi:MAG TPA: response regulator [Rhodospirillaceae bacterium]|nr:response regulator [Rhodospirillaceae bacterium]